MKLTSLHHYSCTTYTTSKWTRTVRLKTHASLIAHPRDSLTYLPPIVHNMQTTTHEASNESISHQRQQYDSKHTLPSLHTLQTGILTVVLSSTPNKGNTAKEPQSVTAEKCNLRPRLDSFQRQLKSCCAYSISSPVLRLIMAQAMVSELPNDEIRIENIEMV